MTIYYSIERTESGDAADGPMSGRQTRHPVYGRCRIIEDCTVQPWMRAAIGGARVTKAWRMRFGTPAEVYSVRLAGR